MPGIGSSGFLVLADGHISEDNFCRP